MKVGDNIAGWELLETINTGGNGVVWKAQKNGKEAALKILQRRHAKSDDRVTRFYDEIAVMRECQDLSGVLPLLDFHFPEEPNATDLPWYCTEIATSMPDVFDQENNVDCSPSAPMGSNRQIVLK